MNPRILLHLAALASLTLSSCVGVPSGPPIADRSLSAEEHKLVGTWTTTHQGRACVIHFFPDRTSRFSVKSSNLMHPDPVQNRRWELVNGLLRETWGMGGTTARCTPMGGAAFRIDDQNGGSYVWRRQSPRPDVSTKWAMDMERARDATEQWAERSAQPQSDFEKFMMKPVGEVFPGWGQPSQDDGRPKCVICGAPIWDSVLGSSTRCSQHRDGFGKIYTR